MQLYQSLSQDVRTVMSPHQKFGLHDQNIANIALHFAAEATTELNVSGLQKAVRIWSWCVTLSRPFLNSRLTFA